MNRYAVEQKFKSIAAFSRDPDPSALYRILFL